MRKSVPSQRALQRAKRSLGHKFGHCEWFRGVGIVPVDDGLALRLNVAPNADIAENEIPATYYNIAVHVVKMGGYELRND